MWQKAERMERGKEGDDVVKEVVVVIWGTGGVSCLELELNDSTAL